MKKKVFDKGLYLEGLRQLRVMGGVMLVLFCLAAVLIPTGVFISADPHSTLIHVGYIEINLPIIFSYSVAAPLLALNLFHFLDRREASDFYHAIPQTRQCLFLSFFAALASWIVLLLVLPALLCLLTCALGPASLTIQVGGVFTYTWHLFVASLLVAAAVALAMSLTGTTFTNIIVALLILFLPRLLLVVARTSVDSLLPYVEGSPSFGLLDHRINVISGTVFGLVLGDPMTSLESLASGLYTLALAVVYGALACFFFCRRRSESAGQAAVSRRMQLVFRLTVALVVCLIPIVWISHNMIRGGFDRDDVFAIFVLYLIAALTYLLYELIATKKWRNMVKALPGLAILAIVNVVMIGGIYAYYSYQSGILPEAGEISSVRLLPDSSASTHFVASSYGVDESQNYLQVKEAEVELTDGKICEMISKRLRETVEYYENERRDYRDQYQFRLVSIDMGSRTIYRRIWLSESDLNLVAGVLKENEEIRQCYQQLPLPERFSACYVTTGNLEEESVRKLYETFRAELMTLDFETCYRLLSPVDDYMPLRMNVSWNEEGQEYYLSLPLTEELPQSQQCYYEELICADAENREEILEVLANPSAVVSDVGIMTVPQSDCVWLSGLTDEKGELVSTLESGAEGETAELLVLREDIRALLLEALTEASGYVPQQGEPLYEIYLEWTVPQENGDPESYGMSSFFCFAEGVLPEELARFMPALLPD